ncbi:glycosyltransferase [Mycolicibacterium lutetiense]|uniref:glycosyltransferase n=1 Tax=Mycolicibacterium lutetiense TaxID=1641992 RepID=UPI001AE3302B|nr:glycosyltransferase [Mycolicibacterium lutetiense]
MRAYPDPLRVGILSTYPPTPCGLATFSAALADGLSATGTDVSVVRVSDGSPSGGGRVVGELVNGSAASVAASSDLLNQNDIAVIQHEYGIYGGPDGAEVVDIIGDLDVPSIVVLHTVPKDPTPQQRSVLEIVAALADQVVVMSESAHRRLCLGFHVERRKVTTIPHGAIVPAPAQTKRGGRPTLLTWGLLGPGKGIERVIDAMGDLHQLNGRPRYLVAGRTHPKVLAADGEDYRDFCIEKARRSGLADAVHFDSGYLNGASLTALLRSAAVVVLPYDSTEQVTSGVLVDAVAHGRPVVATAFPHAVELLGSGAGIVVDHENPEALTSALRSVLTQPRLAGAMAAEARRLAPMMSWSVVANAYLSTARKILADRSELQ